MSEHDQDGKWVDGIPQSKGKGFMIKKICPACSQKFFREATYRGHYALIHILRLKAQPYL